MAALDAAPVVATAAQMVSFGAKVVAGMLIFWSAPTALPRVRLEKMTASGAGGGAGSLTTGGGAGATTGAGASSFLPQAARATSAPRTRTRELDCFTFMTSNLLENGMKESSGPDRSGSGRDC